MIPELTFLLFVATAVGAPMTGGVATSWATDLASPDRPTWERARIWLVGLGEESLAPLEQVASEGSPAARKRLRSVLAVALAETVDHSALQSYPHLRGVAQKEERRAQKYIRTLAGHQDRAVDGARRRARRRLKRLQGFIIPGVLESLAGSQNANDRAEALILLARMPTVQHEIAHLRNDPTRITVDLDDMAGGRAQIGR